MDLFRKSALQKLYSPDQLDQIIRVTKPGNWIVLLGICALLLLAILWGIYGALETTVAGSGIFINAGGVRDVIAAGNGRIIWNNGLKQGDTITVGQIIGQIMDPSLEPPIAAAQAYIDKLQTYKAHTHQKSQQIDLEIASAEYKLHELELQKGVVTKVISPFSGQILELTANNGDYVTKDMQVLRVEDRTQKLQAIIFLTAHTTVALIKPGMLVKVYPGAERQPELGYVIGTVSSVSDFPLSNTALSNLLGSHTLADYFFKNNPPYRVDVDLIPDPHTISGYKWSAAMDKSRKLTGGMMCSASIVISKQSPISLVIPTY